MNKEQLETILNEIAPIKGVVQIKELNLSYTARVGYLLANKDKLKQEQYYKEVLERNYGMYSESRLNKPNHYAHIIKDMYFNKEI